MNNSAQNVARGFVSPTRVTRPVKVIYNNSYTFQSNTALFLFNSYIYGQSLPSSGHNYIVDIE
jgi:hypothetical protein